MIVNSHYQKKEFTNGLRIVTEEIPHVRSIALGVWITVGSRDEELANNGISHFLEHMLFKGTKKRNAHQIAESLEAVGGSLDAFTTKELTCYNAHFLDEHLPIAVDVLSDIVFNSLIKKNEIEKEKEVVLKEINHYKDTPDDMVFEYFYQNVFQSHPLGFYIYGNAENVKSFSRDQLIDFLHDEYTANRIVIAAAGNFKHDQLVELVIKHFTNLPTVKNRTLKEVPLIKSKHTEIIDNCNQAHICLGTRGYSYTDERKFAFMVLHTLLGGGMSSILFQKIREEYGLVYSIYTFHDFFIDSGIWGIYFGTDEERVAQTIDLIKKELNLLKRNYIDDEILIKIKSQLKGNLMLGLESTIGRMNRLAKNEMYLNQYYTLDNVIKKIENVTIQDVAEVANELFCEENYFSTIIQPANNNR